MTDDLRVRGQKALYHGRLAHSGQSNQRCGQLRSTRCGRLPERLASLLLLIHGLELLCTIHRVWFPANVPISHHRIHCHCQFCMPLQGNHEVHEVAEQLVPLNQRKVALGRIKWGKIRDGIQTRSNVGNGRQRFDERVQVPPGSLHLLQRCYSCYVLDGARA